MVGLSIVLEGQKGSQKTPQVINKTTMVVTNKPSSSSFLPSPSSPSQPHKDFLFYSQSPFLAPTFLDHCFWCKQKLLPGKDIYMYKGDKGFCSVECRYRQIFMDEEENILQKNQCSMASVKPSKASSSSASNRRKGGRNRGGGFAY